MNAHRRVQYLLQVTSGCRNHAMLMSTGAHFTVPVPQACVCGAMLALVAQQVAVVGDFNYWDVDANNPMERSRKPQQRVHCYGWHIAGSPRKWGHTRPVLPVIDWASANAPRKIPAFWPEVRPTFTELIKLHYVVRQEMDDNAVQATIRTVSPHVDPRTVHLWFGAAA